MMATMAGYQAPQTQIERLRTRNGVPLLPMANRPAMAFPAPLPPGVGGDTYVTAPRGLEDGTKLAKMVRLAQQMTNVTLEGSAKDETVGYLVNKLVALDKIDPMAVDELQASFDRQASAMAPRNPLALLWMFFFDQMKLLKGVEELQGAFVKELNDRMKRAGL